MKILKVILLPLHLLSNKAEYFELPSKFDPISSTSCSLDDYVSPNEAVLFYQSLADLEIRKATKLTWLLYATGQPINNWNGIKLYSTSSIVKTFRHQITDYATKATSEQKAYLQTLIHKYPSSL